MRVVLGTERRPATFGTCLHRVVAPSVDGAGPVRVRVELDEDAAELWIREASATAGATDADADAAASLPFEHARVCPVHELRKQGVPVNPTTAVRSACAVVVEDTHTGRILLTRRSDALRSFPGAWVVPGGGLERGESLVAAAAREVLEEVGVSVAPADLSGLGVWESCMPWYPDPARPTTHQHIVVYLHAPSRCVGVHNLRVQSSEVADVAFLSRADVEAVLAARPDVFVDAFPSVAPPPSSSSSWSDTHAVSTHAVRFSCQALLDNMTEGTRFALRTWLARPHSQLSHQPSL